MENDNVNHPAHYCQGGIETIEAIKAALGEDGFQSYCAGNVIKYVFRYKYKEGVESLKKARWYLDRLIAEIEKGCG
jgi:hypothetical protein